MDKGKHMSTSDLNKVLPKATAEQYKLVNLGKRTSTRIFNAKHGVVDFKSLSVARAQQLVDAGAPFIELKKTPKSSS